MKDASSQTPFDDFLALLDADRESAGAKYESLRLRLVRFFDWRGCQRSDDLADNCFDRIIKKIADGEVIENVPAYAATVAQFVYKEDLRSPLSRTDSIDDEESTFEPEAPPVVGEDKRMHCLERCLNKFAKGDRELIVAYYDTDERTMIAARKRLAETREFSMNTLRIKVCRLKTKLEKCTKDCCQGD